PKLVPPLAQLKLLRSMQRQINADTQDMNHQMQQAPAAAKKAIQQEIRRLGNLQGALQHQAIKTIKSMQSGPKVPAPMQNIPNAQPPKGRL
ncbi:MAG: hypothetical protein HKL95_04815, partial [Phycisphaerae bacterium]|nr:hypothetical protein [Phycisphaerae bacterium]